MQNGRQQVTEIAKVDMVVETWDARGTRGYNFGSTSVVTTCRLTVSETSDPLEASIGFDMRSHTCLIILCYVHGFHFIGQLEAAATPSLAFTLHLVRAPHGVFSFHPTYSWGVQRGNARTHNESSQVRQRLIS